MKLTENQQFKQAFAIGKGKHFPKVLLIGTLSALSILAIASILFFSRYNTANKMAVDLKEFSKSEYPENPADLSGHYRQYVNRKLTVVKKDANHFDFVLEPTNKHTAKIVFKNIDMRLFVPQRPSWVSKNENLEVISLANREWNRQQVSFKPNAQEIEISGGDGFEKKNLSSVEIANNCLNSGLWEILLFHKEGDSKKLYYQGWFTFPAGHYKNIFEQNNNISYWKHWYKLEHWQNPEGTPVDVQALRQVISEKEIPTKFLADEKIFASGEQKRKSKLLFADNIFTWKDLQNDKSASFASFVAPGKYDVNKPWGNKYWRIANFEKAILRNVKSPATNQQLQELELIFQDKQTNSKNRFLVSGIDINKIPQLAVNDYSKGLYMPMGIGLPPFSQSYEDLKKAPPAQSPYFSVLLDSQNKWINHHDTGLVGVAMHRDKFNPNLLHFYFLSYERHTLVGHYLITLN
ncbi:hypothetical protein [Iningainema tapete]|uniref:Uncharacterized protein n=1 Tax=Iningainema tapete BLCC-T55 TaxID=2748662 RepID=A0A8J6XPX1_9CYAN|nr:hypothetical protein [Iningainema tapete]MBD2775999.1 hypothetical protein [Iningainema tapete BLCC-T55]